jgi:hypothetical protein
MRASANPCGAGEFKYQMFESERDRLKIIFSKHKGSLP